MTSPRTTALAAATLLWVAACAPPAAVPEATDGTPSTPVTADTAGPVTSPPATPGPPTIAGSTVPLSPLRSLAVEVVADDFTEPVLMLPLPGTTDILVVERQGVVRVLRSREPWFDISERVNSEDGIEPGLLGLAFHPDFTENGRFFVYYYRSGREQTTLAEFSTSNGRPDPASEKTLIDIDKPTNRHNGGMLQFGPDGLLYLAVGEGGKASVNSQNPDTHLGKILRIDVDGGDPYSIPADNPFPDGPAPEVVAIGLRNPWRTWIDPEAGLIYIADVGQEDWEEINVVSLETLVGSNFGWLRMEGTSCFQRGCDPVAEGLTLPVSEYPHSEGCSITGGLVYRGRLIPELVGHYFYADWCSGWVRSFRYEQNRAPEAQTWLEDIGQVNSFGFDAEGEMYLLTFDGSVKKVVAVR